MIKRVDYSLLLNENIYEDFLFIIIQNIDFQAIFLSDFHRKIFSIFSIIKSFIFSSWEFQLYQNIEKCSWIEILLLEKWIFFAEFMSCEFYWNLSLSQSENSNWIHEKFFLRRLQCVFIECEIDVGFWYLFRNENLEKELKVGGKFLGEIFYKFFELKEIL